MKEFFKNLIAAKEKRAGELRSIIEKATDVAEARTAMTELENVNGELARAREQLANIEADETRAAQQAQAQGNGGSFNPVATYGQQNANGGAQSRDNTTDKLSTMEYRTAFKNFVQNGTPSELLMRADAEHVSGDLGILLPNTIVHEIIKGVEKVYGQLYSRVKKTNVKGGVQYPIGSFAATMYWDGTAGTDTEHGVTEKQKTGANDKFITFTYHIGEIRIAQSLLQSVLTVEAFEREIVNALVEAYVRDMDYVILEGNGTKQPEGILTEAAKGSASRIPTANIITFSAADMEDWKQWQKKLFAKIPLSMRKLRPEFVMTAETFESNIMTLEDTNGRPVYRETYNPVTGDESATFKGRDVIFVEEGGFKSFDTAATGDYFGMLWVPEKAYLLNSNMQFSYKKYFDEATNQYITKALVIVDGKVLDGKYIFLLKKGAAASS